MFLMKLWLAFKGKEDWDWTISESHKQSRMIGFIIGRNKIDVNFTAYMISGCSG